MGRKKYYCDYCFKSFNDDPKARALHLKSFRHLQLKDDHYRNFRDPAILLQEELAKKPCLKFLNEGYCRFGASCRFSHLVQFELDELRAQVFCQKTKSLITSLPKFSDWWQHRSQVREMSEETHKSHVVNVSEACLPPSLRPFEIADYITGDLPTWG